MRRPCFHHRAPQFHQVGVVIGRFNLVRRGMRERMLGQIAGVPAHLSPTRRARVRGSGSKRSRPRDVVCATNRTAGAGASIRWRSSRTCHANDSLANRRCGTEGINCPCRPKIRTACVWSMKRQDLAVADPPGTWIDKPGETKKSHNADRANDEECCQHDVIVTKRN